MKTGSRARAHAGDKTPAMRGQVRVAMLSPVVLLIAGWAAAQSAPSAPLNELLDRASRFTIEFVDKLSNVVAEEWYVQDSNVFLRAVPISGLAAAGRGGPSLSGGAAPTSAKHRELKADFLIVNSRVNQWQPFRDVFEVDGIAIRDRDARLAKLFFDKKADAEARATAIAEESARYNLGAVQRTINNPIFPLVFLEPEERQHVQFTIGKPDRALSGVRVVEYVEQGRPTLIRGWQDQNMPAFGRFWIESETGRVVKAELRVEQPGVKANLTTEFRTDERLGIDVPAQMHEDYQLTDSHVTGKATYSRFRRFGVESTEEISPPATDTSSPP